jgi:hypothetical protein
LRDFYKKKLKIVLMIPFKANIINEIRRLLRDRYKGGFPIIKEILQNADDSGATRLDFGWTSGLPTAKHVLLQRPALFFLNNGEFTQSNEQSIISYSMDDRAEQKASIGKFGLGQKSVFHLCDAFFFLGASQSENFQTANLLNPWATEPNNDPRHPDWKPFLKEDERLIKDYLKKITLPASYFILWIPLRQKNDQSIIVKAFPGEHSPEELFINDLANDISVLLPLLHSLTEIHYWLPNRQNHLKRQFHILLKGERRLYPSNAEKDPIGDFQFNGNLLEKITGKNSQFVGQESLLDIGEYENQLKSFFPQHDTGTGETVPDKSIPHSAVTLTKHPTKQGGTLSIQWAVFLPVGDPKKQPNEQISYSGRYDFTLFLHGYFFLDSGRSRIEAWEKADLTQPPTQESEATQQWNQLVATKGTLKNVLPTLNLFIQTYQPNLEDIWQLSNALKNSTFFRQYGKEITQKSQWVYCYVIDEKDWQWQYIDTNQPLLAIPQAETDQTSLLPWEVLPNLEAESIRPYLITLIDAPNLTTSLSDWSENQLETVLQDVQGHVVFKNQQQFEYLLSFLEQCVIPLYPNQILPEMIQNRLFDIARKAFAQLDVNQFKEWVTKFLNFIPKKCFFIDCKTYQPKIFFELHKLDTHTLLIPRIPTFDFYELKITAKPKLAKEEALTLLEKLNGIIHSEKDKKIIDYSADIAREILGLVADKKSVVKTYPDLRVLRAHNCRVSQNQTTIISFKDIINAYQECTLFRHKGGFIQVEEKRKFVNPLQNVLVQATVIIIEKGVADLLDDIGQKEIMSCDQLGCLRALSREPALKDNITDRVELLELLLNADLEDKDIDVFTKGIRHLLTIHKLEEHLEDKHPLWYLTSREYQSIVEPILTARGETPYLIHDAFVQSVTNQLANDKRALIGIEELTLIKAIELALSYDKPHTLCQNILDALQDVDIKSLSDSDRLMKKLRQKPWLLDQQGAAIKPEEVVYLPQITETVNRIIGELTPQNSYRNYVRLEDKIQNHESFHKLYDLPLFAVGSDGLNILGLMMFGDEKYHLGQFSKESFPFRKCLTVFKDMTPDILPAWPIIRIANESYPDAVQSLLSDLFVPMPTQRLIKLLIWLKEQHILMPITTTKELILEVFNSYLAIAVHDEHFHDRIFLKLSFLSRAGHWKSPSQLSLEAQTIDEDDLLNHTQAHILQPYVKSIPDPIIKEVEDNKNILDFERYFRKWTDKINHELIGIFLALLGDAVLSAESQSAESLNTSLTSQLAQAYLGEHSTVENVRKALVTHYQDHFLVKVNAIQHGTGQVELMGLEGTRFQAQLCETANSIFIDHRIQKFSETSQTLNVKIGEVKQNINISSMQKLFTIDLLDIDIERQYDSNSLSHLLKEASASVLRYVYNQSNTDALEQLWDKFSKTEQLDIETTRQWILTNAPFYLIQQLNYNSMGRYHFHQLLQEWEILESPQNRLADKDDKKQSLITQIAEVIENQVEEQSAILEAIKTKISSNYQYHPESVPFELFQNADDAVVELEEMSCQLEQSQHFVLSWDERRLTVIHWGRPINWFRYGHYSGEEGKKRGFDTDLKKMLVLNSSTKGEKVTGKFGLGFKSVFLICQKPRILSGHPTISSKQLGFQIMAGFLPKALNDEERRQLVDTLQSKTPNHLPVGTLFELALDKAYTPNHIVDSFQQVVGVLLAFSKRIKSCELGYPSGHHSVIWQPTEIIEGIYIGHLKLKYEQDEPNTILLIQNPEREGILIVLGSQGVERLPEQIPDIWVTAPLKESMGFHFALNGRFEIDIGRAQLAPNSNHNREIARNIAHFVGQKLCDLFQKHQESAFNFNDKLGLSSDLSDYDFWYSIWKILGESGSQNQSLIKRKLGDFILIKPLLEKKPAFPTGLWGPYRVLTDFHKIKSVTMGLMQDKSYFEEVATWKAFQTQFVPGTIVSNEQWNQLQKLLPEAVEGKAYEGPNDFYLADAVELSFEQTVSPEIAKQLGTLISRDLLEQLAKEPNGKEYDYLLKLLGKTHFKAQDGEYHPVSTVLYEPVKTSELQEKSHQSDLNFFKVLSSDYTDEALIFFKACRRQYDMAEWSEMAEQLQIPMLQKLVREDKEKREQQKQTLDQKAVNKKIGENVELIIKKFLRDKGVHVKTIEFGGDFEIWPKEYAVWDSGYITISSKIKITVEIKFTSGSEVHLTKRQSETARIQKSRYIVLVVNGEWGLRALLKELDEESISDELITAIKYNSHVIKNLSEKLGELPNPKEIKPDIHGYWLKKALWENQDNIVTWLENELQ